MFLCMDNVCMYRSFLDNDMEMEFALPSTIDDESIECSIQLAEEMSILYKKGGRVSSLVIVLLWNIPNPRPDLLLEGQAVCMCK